MVGVRQFVLRNFEIIVVLILVFAAAFVILVSTDKIAFLNFFYIPTLVSAYYLGRNRGVLTGLVAVLLVTFYAVINPAIFAEQTLSSPSLSVLLWGSFLLVTAYVVGTLYDHKAKNVNDLHQAYEGILELVAKFIDAVDGYTQDHSVRVSQNATMIAKAMGLSAAEVENVRVAGLLHDVGKIDINIEVLTKASKLSDVEWRHMQTHTSKGSDILAPIGGLLGDVIPIVQNHHEYYDGSGYSGVSGDSIPLGARILAVSDAYDSMITDRPYRTGRTPWEARNELERNAGTQFDPQVIAAFVSVMKDEIQHA